MALPTRITVDDIQSLCSFFSKKPTGATLAEAKAILDAKYLDSKKIYAMKMLGFLSEQGDRLKATPKCREIAKENGANRELVLQDILLAIPAYKTILERAYHKGETLLELPEVGSHWNDYFTKDISSSENILNEQVSCFFQLAEGAGLGKYIIGRKGASSRFEIFHDKLDTLFSGIINNEEELPSTQEDTTDYDTSAPEPEEQKKSQGKGIFIAHGKNKKPLEQLKRILDQFKIPYKVAIDEPNLGRPISEKIREIMQACNCAILIFSADEEFVDKSGNTIWRPSENVIYELGAAGYLYDNQIVIIKESNVDFPTNFRDIGYILFEKDELEVKAMDILKELIGFGIVKIST